MSFRAPHSNPHCSPSLEIQWFGLPDCWRWSPPPTMCIAKQENTLFLFPWESRKLKWTQLKSEDVLVSIRGTIYLQNAFWKPLKDWLLLLEGVTETQCYWWQWNCFNFAQYFKYIYYCGNILRSRCQILWRLMCWSTWMYISIYTYLFYINIYTPTYTAICI